MDLASAAKHYAKKHGLGKEAITYANVIEVSAEIKLGEILAEIEKNKGVQGQLAGKDSSGGPLALPPEDAAPTLKELGISKTYLLRHKR